MMPRNPEPDPKKVLDELMQLYVQTDAYCGSTHPVTPARVHRIASQAYAVICDLRRELDEARALEIRLYGT